MKNKKFAFSFLLILMFSFSFGLSFLPSIQLLDTSEVSFGNDITRETIDTYSLPFNNHLKISGLTHAPILISSNSGFTTGNGVVGGDGSENDPYIIANWTIDAGGTGSCIYISGTTVYFVIKNCTLYNSGTDIYDAGIHLRNSRNAIIDNNTIHDNQNGIYLQASINIMISGNNCSSNSQGIFLRNSSNDNTISENTCTSNTVGILLLSSSNNTISGNNCTSNGSHAIYVSTSNKIYISGNNCSLNLNWGIVVSESCNNTISRNIFSLNGHSGIEVDGSTNNEISMNTCSSNSENGILFQSASDNEVSRNNCSSNFRGIYLLSSNNNMISENNYSSNYQGIYIQSSSNNTISENTCTSNNDEGIRLISSNNNMVSGNDCTSNEIYGIHMYSSSNYNTVSNNDCTSNDNVGIKLTLSDNNKISGNNCSSKDHGISAYSSNNNTISRNNCSSVGHTGIYFYSSSNYNTFSNNDCTSNVEHGIYLYTSEYNTILGNTIRNNSNGIKLDSTSNNKIFLNNFISNGLNAEDDGTNNSWDDGYIGNYWDDYSGVDANDDGIGDTPYIIPGTAGSQDNFPIYDNIAPVITIFFPLLDSAFGFDAPNYDISIDEINLNTIWYTFDGGGTNYTTTSLTGTFNQTAWEVLSEDNITIEFYANDAEGNVGSAVVTVEKDINAPVIIINNPLLDSVIGLDAPNYNISIDELNLDTIWYTLDGGITNYTITGLTGTFNQTAWEALSEDNITIEFYANDAEGNVGSAVVTVEKDINAPVIIINNPLLDSVIGLDAPNYNISIDELNLDTIWYTLDGGITNYTITGLTGTFNQTAWGTLSEGSVTIRFYANDTVENISSAAVTVKKDTVPIITIISPLADSVFGLDAPNYNISINELNLDTIWYTLDEGGTNHTITHLTGTFNQTAWEALSEGSITIRFYANDTAGNVGSTAVTVEKDLSAPVISIIVPLADSVFGLVAPNYNISIDELNMDKIWYTLDGGGINYTITSFTGTFNQTAWEALSEGSITIRFYANDTAGNVGSTAVTVEKDLSAPVISIIVPLADSVFGLVAPNYNISIDELNMDTIWYTLDGGGINYTITSLTGTLSQAAWEALSEGSVTIGFYANDTAGNIGFVVVIIEKDINAPVIIINNPLPDVVIALLAPNYNISINEINLDTIWYTLDEGITNHTITSLTGTLSQAAWEGLSEGSVIFRVYANDSAGNVGLAVVTVEKDISAPIIIINTPLIDTVFGLIAPNYNITIDELNLDTIWYTLDGGITNYTITNLIGALNQAAWEALSEGYVTIRFYANDTAGNVGLAVVTVEKDISAPVIIINTPLIDTVFGLIAPNYNITIDELNLDTIWYTLDGGITNYTITNLIGH